MDRPPLSGVYDMKPDDHFALMLVTVGWTLVGTVLVGCTAFGVKMLFTLALEIVEAVLKLIRGANGATTDPRRSRFAVESFDEDDSASRPASSDAGGVEDRYSAEMAEDRR